MHRASLNDENGTCDQRKEAFVVVAVVHLIKLNDCREHVRVIVLEVFCQVVEPGVLCSKEDAWPLSALALLLA